MPKRTSLRRKPKSNEVRSPSPCAEYSSRCAHKVTALTCTAVDQIKPRTTESQVGVERDTPVNITVVCACCSSSPEDLWYIDGMYRGLNVERGRQAGREGICFCGVSCDVVMVVARKTRVVGWA